MWPKKETWLPSSLLTGAERQPRSPDSWTRSLFSVFLQPTQSDDGSFRKKEGDILHLLPGTQKVTVTLKPLLCCVQILSPGLALGRRFKVKPSERKSRILVTAAAHASGGFVQSLPVPHKTGALQNEKGSLFHL